MLTIDGIRKLCINAIMEGKPNDYNMWSVVDVEAHNEYYQIQLKCNKCSPVGPMLGAEISVILHRHDADGLLNPTNKVYKLHCFGKKTRYVSTENLLAPGLFVAELVKLLNNN